MKLQLLRALTYRPKHPLLTDADGYCVKTTMDVDIKQIDAYHDLVNWRPGIASNIHPLWFQVASLPLQLKLMTQHPFPFRPIGLVHLTNSVNRIEEISTTSPIEIEAKLERFFQHKRGIVVSVKTRLLQQNRVKSLGDSMYLARLSNAQIEKVARGYSLESFESSATDISQTGSNFNRFETLEYAEDIGRRYALVSGDYNPIHLYPFTAKWFGFKRAIAHGMYSKARVISKHYEKNKSFAEQPNEIFAEFNRPILLPTQTILNSGQRQVNTGDSSNCRTLYHYRLIKTPKNGEVLGRDIDDKQVFLRVTVRRD